MAVNRPGRSFNPFWQTAPAIQHVTIFPAIFQGQARCSWFVRRTHREHAASSDRLRNCHTLIVIREDEFAALPPIFGATRQGLPFGLAFIRRGRNRTGRSCCLVYRYGTPLVCPLDSGRICRSRLSLVVRRVRLIWWNAAKIASGRNAWRTLPPCQRTKAHGAKQGNGVDRLFKFRCVHRRVPAFFYSARSSVEVFFRSFLISALSVEGCISRR